MYNFLSIFFSLLLYPVITSTKTVQAPATPAQTAAEIPATRGPKITIILNNENDFKLFFIFTSSALENGTRNSASSNTVKDVVSTSCIVD